MAAKDLVKIYCLKDPDSGEIRYVGKTSQRLTSRLATHVCRKRNYKQSNKYNHTESWIDSLKNKEKRPIIEVIEEVPFENWEAKEIFYIKYFKDLGYNLTNHSSGGDKSNFGCRWTLKDKKSMENRILSRSTPCIMIDLKLNKVQEFKSFVEMSRNLGIKSAVNANRKKHLVKKRYLILTKEQFINLKKGIYEC